MCKLKRGVRITIVLCKFQTRTFSSLPCFFALLQDASRLNILIIASTACSNRTVSMLLQNVECFLLGLLMYVPPPYGNIEYTSYKYIHPLAPASLSSVQLSTVQPMLELHGGDKMFDEQQSGGLWLALQSLRRIQTLDLRLFLLSTARESILSRLAHINHRDSGSPDLPRSLMRNAMGSDSI